MNYDQLVEMYVLIETLDPKPHEQIAARKRLVARGLLDATAACEVKCSDAGRKALVKL